MSDINLRFAYFNNSVIYLMRLYVSRYFGKKGTDHGDRHAALERGMDEVRWRCIHALDVFIQHIYSHTHICMHTYVFNST